MKNLGNTLKNIRINKNFSQTELSKDIMSRQLYSKVENNSAEITFNTLEQLLQKMNVGMIDFLREYNKSDLLSQYKNLLLKAFKKDITPTEAKELNDFVEANKHLSSEHLSLFVLTKSHVHIIYPAIVSNIKKNDINDINKYILSLQGEYTLHDLKLIGDCARYLPLNNLKKIYNKFPRYDLEDFTMDNSIYRVQIHKIYNNFCDIALAEKDLAFAKKVLLQHKRFSNVYSEIRYLFYIKINEIILTYLETKEFGVLFELNTIADTLESIGELGTAKAIRSEFIAYAQDTQYDPKKTITKDS